MQKRITSIILIFAIILSTFIPVLASSEGDYLKQAENLKLLGIFQGTDNGFELDRQTRRIEGLAMLIGLLGKEEDAKVSSKDPCYFKDVPEWGQGYVNYAYKNGLSKGISKNLFGSDNSLSAKDYMTFMLRALGYNDSKGDFSYDHAIDFAKEKNILTEEDAKELNSQAFLRDHLAKLSMISLNSNIKDKNTSLLDKLVDEGVILKSIADQIGETDKENLEVHFIDVGQGDSILIKKGKQSMLIDAGNSWNGDLIVNYLKDQNVTSLKYVVGTHPHADHIGGMSDVVNNFEISNIIMPDVIATTKTFEDLLDSIKDKEVSTIKGESGLQYDLNGSEINILAPNADKYRNLNNYSVAVKITNGLNAFLFTGDAEEKSEIEMIESHKDLLKSDLLKLGHHGSNTSTTREFLDIVDPKYAVITVGKDNRYGHPDGQVLNRLKAKGVQVYRTDLDGNIIAISDGKTIIFKQNSIGE